MQAINILRSKAFIALGSLLLFAPPANAQTLQEQVDALKKQVRELEALIKAQQAKEKKAPVEVASEKGAGETDAKFVQFNSTYGYQVLDPTTRINRKQQFILESKDSGVIKPGTLTLSGSVWADSDYQQSNVSDKFGWLMRHPTFRNQQGNSVSHALIHSAQFSTTYAANNWITAYAELLYDPEQSFGSGTITDVNRNQVQLRRGYVLLGDTEKFPLYASIGKMAIPFGLTDTVNPFTNSTVWHSFGGLAYGARAGYLANGFDISAMAVQGGAQFRAANTPVFETAVPSQLNNYSFDGSYAFNVNHNLKGMIGSSFIRGSAYCQDFPVLHFMPCDQPNSAYDMYSKWNIGKLELLGEFAKTNETWPGTLNPAFPQWEESKVTSWMAGAKYPIAKVWGKELDLSFSFSRFIAGPAGSPWNKQDQWVVGLQSFVTPSVKLFAEYIHVNGFVPLNNISDPTVSTQDVKNGAGVIGVAAAF